MKMIDISVEMGIQPSDPNYGRIKIVMDDESPGQPTHLVLDEATQVAKIVGFIFERPAYKFFIDGAVLDDAALAQTRSILAGWAGGLQLTLEPAAV